MIDLQVLNYQDKIIINKEIIISKEYYEKTDIVNLNKVKVNGYITLNDVSNYYLLFHVESTMTLHDSLTYELVHYPFTIDIEETLENFEKTLDLIEFLWHYIVLEIPLRFTNSELVSTKTNDYQIISEEEYSKKKNPFSDFFVE